MKKSLLLLAVLLLTSCSRSIDSFIDGVKKDALSVKSSKLECYSGSVKYFEYIGDNRVWISQGGHYEIVTSKGLTTLTGDCVLTEEF